MKIETRKTVRVEREGRIETWWAGERHEVSDELADLLIEGGSAIAIDAAPAAPVVAHDPEPEADIDTLFVGNDEE